MLSPVCEHGELIDDCRVEKPDVALPVSNVFIRTSSVTSGALTLRIQVVVLGKAFAFWKTTSLIVVLYQGCQVQKMKKAKFGRKQFQKKAQSSKQKKAKKC